jgi:hypothetical protein
MANGLLSLFDGPVERARFEMFAEAERKRERQSAKAQAKLEAEREEMARAISVTMHDALAEEAEEMLDLTAATRLAYERDFRRFREWCAAEGLPPLPAWPEGICYFLMHMAGAEEQPPMASIRRMTAAIAAAHRICGHPNPCDDLAVRAALRHIGKRLRPKPEPAEDNKQTEGTNHGKDAA